MAFNNTIIARVAASVWGLKLGNGTMNAALQQANTAPGGLNAVINGAFNDSYSQVDDATISSMVVANLGLTGAAATAGTAARVAGCRRTGHCAGRCRHASRRRAWRPSKQP